MHEVFISYSTKDKKWADAACAVLESHKARCWIAPRDITPGTEWGAAITSGIDACKIMVLIFSTDANNSAQVRREVELAISKGMPLIPCRIENVLPFGAMKYALSATHWLDAFTPPVERQMKVLAESVLSLLGRPLQSSNPDAASAAKPALHSLTPPRKASQLRKRRAFAAVGVGMLLIGVLIALITRTPGANDDGAKKDIPVVAAEKPDAAALVKGEGFSLRPLDRVPMIRAGSWRVDGDQLIQTDAAMAYPDIYFGDYEWTDYDFSVQARRYAGTDFFALHGRCVDEKAFKFQVGSYGNRQYQLLRLDQSGWTDVRKASYVLQNNVVYKTVLKVRGHGYQVIMNNQVVTDYVDPLRIGGQGRVGLGTNTAACRFAKIEVRSSAGKLLWTGPPDIDPTKSAAGEQLAAMGLAPLEQAASERASATPTVLPGSVLVGVTHSDNGRSSPSRIEIKERTGDHFQGIIIGEAGTFAIAGTLHASDVAYEFGNVLMKNTKSAASYANNVAFAGKFERGILEGGFSTHDGKRAGVQQKLNLAAVYTGIYQFVAGAVPKGKLQIEITQRQQNHFKGTLTSDDGPTTWVITGTVGKDDVQWQWGDIVSKAGTSCENLTNNCRFTGTCKNGVVQGQFFTLDNTQKGSLQALQLGVPSPTQQ
jgi:hypothetical protein